MSTRNTEDIIGALYDMVQDARSVPLNADKCMVERDKVLDMLDEIITNLPSELKQSRTIVESRNELISQARSEAATIIRQAQEQAEELVNQEAIYTEARRRSEELVKQTHAKIQLYVVFIAIIKQLFKGIVGKIIPEIVNLRGIINSPCAVCVMICNIAHNQIFYADFFHYLHFGIPAFIVIRCIQPRLYKCTVNFRYMLLCRCCGYCRYTAYSKADCCCYCGY